MSLVRVLKDGRELPTRSGSCSTCENEFFWIDHVDYIFKYCPYCGIRFDVRTDDATGEQTDVNP